MTDYLEELFRGADALLEQMRRLEGSTAHPGSEAEQEKFLPLESPQGGQKKPDWNRNIVEAEPREDGEVPEEKREQQNRTEVSDTLAGLEETVWTEEQGQNGGEEFLGDAMSPAWEESVPLLDQLERLERAAAVLEGGEALRQEVISLGENREAQVSYPLALTKTRSGQAVPAPEVPAGWSGWIAPESAQTASGGDLSLAEQTDQAFRRDSRRYDGGFYLY